MRRAVEERRGQPRGPQIRRQLAEIHVIVAGDGPLSHVILRSMDVSPRRAATGRSYRVPPLSRTHYPYLELQVLERDGDRLEARPFLGSSNQIIEAARARLSLRTVPGMDAREAGRLIVKKLTTKPPYGVKVTAKINGTTPRWTTAPDGPAFDAARGAPKPGVGHET